STGDRRLLMPNLDTLDHLVKSIEINGPPSTMNTKIYESIHLSCKSCTSNNRNLERDMLLSFVSRKDLQFMQQDNNKKKLSIPFNGVGKPGVCNVFIKRWTIRCWNMEGVSVSPFGKFKSYDSFYLDSKKSKLRKGEFISINTKGNEQQMAMFAQLV